MFDCPVWCNLTHILSYNRSSRQKAHDSRGNLSAEACRHSSTIQYYSTQYSVLQYYSTTVLQYYSTTVLLYSTTVLQYYSTTVLHTTQYSVLQYSRAAVQCSVLQSNVLGAQCCIVRSCGVTVLICVFTVSLKCKDDIQNPKYACTIVQLLK